MDTNIVTWMHAKLKINVRFYIKFDTGILEFQYMSKYNLYNAYTNVLLVVLPTCILLPLNLS